MKDIAELHKWLDSLRAKDRSRDWTPEIRSLVETTTDQMERRELKLLLVDELRRQFRNSETRAVLEELTSAFPNDPFVHASLASQLHYIERASIRALVEVQQAVRKAKATSRYIFYSLTLQADIATSLEDFALVEATLKEAMAFSMPAELIDIAPELHYLKRIPKGAIDEDLRSRFIDFARNIRRTRGFEIAPGSRGSRS